MLPSPRMIQPLMRRCRRHQYDTTLIGTGISQSSLWSKNSVASYFTNTDRMKADDPYATLGLQWGATTTEIKTSFRNLATKYHPDVNKEDSPVVAIKKFQNIKRAYEKLMDVKGAPHRDDLREEWSFAVWRNSDVIAQDRTDVAGAMRKRPVKPAQSIKKGSQWGIATLGHPDGGGNAPRQKRGEYLGDGGKSRKGSAHSVGTGQSKWVKPKEFKPWNPGDVKVKGVSAQK
uniref:J domain-containing protein n=1 Tax=Ditylum brightwellii TaxID=49249 RepID=A0A7S1ZMM7_9STRA|mmetsp:Transcript_3479/g.5369  ORF Transcript_3479/g.5369 Transcript_3479/m.5369 type:complete len:231 (+) Transcript_3479:131-823(+)